MVYVREHAVQTRRSCALCGSEAGVTLRRYKKTHTPEWVWLLVLIGLLPALIVSAIVSTTHTLTVPYCSRCALRRRFSPVVSWGAGISAIVVLFVGIGIGVSMGSWIPALLGAVAAVLIAVAAGKYAESVSPRFVTFNAERVVIADARRGLVVLVPPQPGQLLGL